MDSNTLEIRLLGEFALLRDGREVPAPTLKKARILVAQLALRAGHEFVRDDLSTHLWPDVEIETARFNLRQLIARIRRAAPDLSPFIVAKDRTTLRFDGTLAEIDALEFKRLIASSPELAMRLYRGPLLEGIDDGWLGPPRAELEELFFNALELLADKSEPREAVAWLRRAIEADPYRELLQQKLLSRLAECGDLSGMQVAFRNFMELLHREVHIAPSDETVRLYRHLLSAQGASVAPRPKPLILRNRLPVPVTEVLGREAEIQEVCGMLRKVRLVTLLGPGGAGKTRLAIAIGDKEQTSREAGVWFADFSSVGDPTRVPQTLGQSLGLRESAGMGWLEALVECIGSSDFLLIFDNCEHLVEACAQVANQLSKCADLRIIATSRVPLGVDGEQRFNVPSLELPSSGSTTDVIDYQNFSALKLFETRARLVSPAFAVTPENATRVISICKEVDALPFGIEMAAARLSALSLDEVARRLVDKLSFLRDPARVTTPRRQTLGAVIHWSYDLLSEDGKMLLQRLSVFGGGWTIDAAEAVCGFDTLAPDRILNAMVDLAEASLVQRRDDRYQFLETVRQFAETRLSESSDKVETKDRHLRYFTEFCDDIETRIAAAGPDRVAVQYRPDLDNIRNALAWSIQSRATEAGLRLVSNASLALSILQLDYEAADWLRQILALEVEETTSSSRISALKRACRFYKSNHAHLDRPAASENTTRVCEELVELAKNTGDQQALADALYDLAQVSKSLDVAREYINESLEINRALPSGGHSHRPLSLMGFWAENSGAFDEAQGLFEQAEQQAQQAGDVGALINMLQSQSHLLREQCQYEGALAKLQEIERISRDWCDARATAFNNLRLAELHLDCWDFAAMAGPLAKARTFYEESRSKFHEMLVDGLLRYLAAHEGRIAQGVEGLSGVASKLISGAYRSNWAWWHGAGIEMEALSYCLSRSGEPKEGARFFGAAQALRERDKAFLSPGVRSRWNRLSDAAGFGPYEAQILEGSQLTPEQVVALAEEKENRFCRPLSAVPSSAQASGNP